MNRLAPPAPRPPAERRPAPRARLRVRPAERADRELLVRHRRKMWQAIGRRTKEDLDRADPVYRRWLVRESRARRLFAYVVEDRDGQALGSGAVWLAPTQPRPGRLVRTEMPYVLSMFTEPRARGRGVASQILRTIVRWSRDRGYARITLHASDQGRPVYERLGFVPGREMRLDLRPGHAPRRRDHPRARGRSSSL